MRSFGIVSMLIIMVLAAPEYAFSHGGGLDSYGCHHNRKAGGYHCHRGPFAGEQFSSQADMLKKLGQQEKSPSDRPAGRR
ncbi:YHYH domain-containing protein [Candidatus Uhrbacteria bacterium]|nr:YHYH domain-containing protein [Candidatus Uhrbacteria bacterium]